MLIFLMSLAIAKQYSFMGHWNETPNIIVCERSGVLVEDVTKAAEYWREKGYKLGSIEKRSSCTTKYPNGFIQFNDPKNDVDTVRSFGHSQLQQHASTITSVSIQISPEGAQYYEVIAHELGHALGIHHVDDINDIMYINHVYEFTRF